MVVSTSVWGDHWGDGADSDDLVGTVNVLDISAAVDKVKDLATAFPEPRVCKKDANPDPNGADVNVLEAAFTVDAVKNLPYPTAFTISVCN